MFCVAVLLCSGLFLQSAYAEPAASAGQQSVEMCIRDRYSYQVFKKGVYRDGTSETGSIVYHVTGAEGVDALTLLINNRACNGAKTIVSISLDLSLIHI